MSRMTDEALRTARQDVLGELDLSCECADEEDVPEGKHVAGCDQGAAEAGFNTMCFDHDRARRAETEQAAELERLRAYGGVASLMANVCFNLGQPGSALTDHDRDTLRSLQRKWDALHSKTHQAGES